MNKQNQWLFEAPIVTTPASNQEYYSNSEWEAEWELQEMNSYAMGEQEWETLPRSRTPNRLTNRSTNRLTNQRASPTQARRRSLPRPPVNRGSREYIRWIQMALNQILGSNLTIDGISGPKTRNAVRRFQSARGLQVDGIVGSKTEASIISSLQGASQGQITSRKSICRMICPTLPREYTVARYNSTWPCIDIHQIKSVESVEDDLFGVLTSGCGCEVTEYPKVDVTLTGHTSRDGTEEFNQTLGSKRAQCLRDRLVQRLRERLLKCGFRPKDVDERINSRITFYIGSEGENNPVVVDETNEDARRENRRVEVYLSKISCSSGSPKEKRMRG